MPLEMKKIYLFLLAALLCCSCTDYLNVTPENSQVADDYWRTQQDVENFLIGGYYQLRETVVDYLIPWGECRAGLVYNAKSNTKLQSWQMQASNTSLCDWSDFYKIINIANTVLARADEACANDETYSESARNSHYSEAYFLRALSYFYLVRNFRDVPLVLQAYEDDKVKINLPKTSEDTVVMQIKNDLLAALETGAAKEVYGTTWETKGRATRWAIYALMADVCLWKGDYADAVTYCDFVLQSDNLNAPRFLSTPSRSVYMSMFNPGNSKESIFELQWNREENQTNNLPALFDNDPSNTQATYAVSEAACRDFVNEYATVLGAEFEDATVVTKEAPRTYHAAFAPEEGQGMSLTMSKGYVWKYVGSTTEDKKRTTNYYDPNFIIYRVADVMLMQAEAYLCMDGAEPTAQHKLEALKLINRVRQRAALENYAEETEEAVTLYSQLDLLTEVLDQRKLEFLGEGKIWYDFLRMGRRNDNQYKDALLVDQVLAYNTSASASWLKSALTSDNALFLPIMSTEIERNENLIQNPYYK